MLLFELPYPWWTPNIPSSSIAPIPTMSWEGVWLPRYPYPPNPLNEVLTDRVGTYLDSGPWLASRFIALIALPAIAIADAVCKLIAFMLYRANAATDVVAAPARYLVYPVVIQPVYLEPTPNLASPVWT